MPEKHLSASKTGSTQETSSQKGTFFAHNELFRSLPTQELDELERSGKGTALVNLCVGAGMGTGIIIERV